MPRLEKHRAGEGEGFASDSLVFCFLFFTVFSFLGGDLIFITTYLLLWYICVCTCTVELVYGGTGQLEGQGSLLHHAGPGH